MDDRCGQTPETSPGPPYETPYETPPGPPPDGGAGPARTREEGSEDGRIALLVIGLVVLVLGFVLVGATLTAVHVQDRRLLSCADRVASAASGVADADTFYTSGGQGRLVPSRDTATLFAHEALWELAGTTCRVGGGVGLDGVEVVGGQVVVSVSARAQLPVVPAFLGRVAAPVLTASSSALTR